jgi:RNA polymerase sigma-70 factor (family 1)
MHENLKSLVTEVASGNQKAFRTLFDLFSSKVYFFAFKLLRSESMAEEVVQEVFIKIWVNRASLQSIDFFPSYLYTIARNYSLNVLKKVAFEEKAKVLLRQQQPTCDEETEQNIVYRDYQHILNSVIEQLPPQQKLVYSLCHNEGLKYEEAAQRLNISRLTVKSHMQQALRTIKANFSRLLVTLLIVQQL